MLLLVLEKIRPTTAYTSTNSRKKSCCFIARTLTPFQSGTAQTSILLPDWKRKKNRIALGFDLIEFIQNFIEPVHWKGTKYNSKYRITRYMRGEYISLRGLTRLLSEDLEKTLKVDEGTALHFEDGRIFYVLPQSEEELTGARKLLKQKTHRQILFVLPRQFMSLYEVSLEVYAYSQMQKDPRLIESDPLILPELQQLADDALDYMQKLLYMSVTPFEGRATLYYRGNEERVKDSRALRIFISQIFDEVFDKTPKLNNEMINRRKPRRNLVNARKKLILPHP